MNDLVNIDRFHEDFRFQLTNDEKNKIIYHLGASLKDLGNKWFAFSKLEDDNLELLEGRI